MKSLCGFTDHILFKQIHELGLVLRVTWNTDNVVWTRQAHYLIYRELILCIEDVFLLLCPDFSKLLLSGHPYFRLRVGSSRCPILLIFIYSLHSWALWLDSFTTHIFSHFLTYTFYLPINWSETFWSRTRKSILRNRYEARSSDSNILLLDTVLLCRIVWNILVFHCIE